MTEHEDFLVEYCKPNLKRWLDDGYEYVVVYKHKSGLAFINNYRKKHFYAADRFYWSTHGYTPRIVFDTNFYEVYDGRS